MSNHTQQTFDPECTTNQLLGLHYSSHQLETINTHFTIYTKSRDVTIIAAGAQFPSKMWGGQTSIEYFGGSRHK